MRNIIRGAAKGFFIGLPTSLVGLSVDNIAAVFRAELGGRANAGVKAP